MGINDSASELSSKIIYGIILAVFAGALCYLYYNQIVHYPDLFESDTAVHVSFAINDHYFHSLAAFIYLGLSYLPFTNYLIAGLLSGVTVGTVFLTKEIIEWIFEIFGLEIEGRAARIMALFANLLLAFYVPIVNERHYIGYQSANMWHNSTYLFMRFVACFFIIEFLKVLKTYKEGISLKKWFILSGLLALTTAFKASFLTVFAPFLLTVLIINLINKAKFINLVKMGTIVFPAIGVMLIESLVLFGDSSSGISIAPFKALAQRGDHPKVAIICSVMFPLVVFIFNIREFYKDKIYLGGLLFALIGFLEVFLFIETGDRKLDSNFFWGYSIALFVLFVVSMIKAYISYIYSSKTKLKKLIALIEGFVLLWHVMSGVWYLSLLLTGVTYFV